MRALASRRYRSRRFRRRVGLAGAGGCIVALVTGAILIGNTADPPLPLSNHPVILEEPRPRVKLTARDRREILRTAQLFVDSAVRRDRPERAWPIASPMLKAGQTLAAWKAGSMPVEPYPVRRARSTFAYSIAGEVGLDVWVDATDAKLSAMVFRLTLVALGKRPRPSWLVDGWSAMPAGGFVSTPWRDENRQRGEFTPRASASVSGLWVVVPFVMLALALLVAITVMVHDSRGGRRFRRRSA